MFTCDTFLNLGKAQGIFVLEQDRGRVAGDRWLREMRGGVGKEGIGLAFLGTGLAVGSLGFSVLGTMLKPW